MSSTHSAKRNARASITAPVIRAGAIDVDVNADDIATPRTRLREHSTVRRMQVVDPHKPLAVTKFVLHRVMATPGAIALLVEHNVDMLLLIRNHQYGDWGDSDSDEIALNNFAVDNELRVMSTFRMMDWRTLSALNTQDRAELPTVWIITEHDRSLTTVLLATEY